MYCYHRNPVVTCHHTGKVSSMDCLSLKMEPLPSYETSVNYLPVDAASHRKIVETSSAPLRYPRIWKVIKLWRTKKCLFGVTCRKIWHHASKRNCETNRIYNLTIVWSFRMRPGSSVVEATSYGLDSWGSNPAGGEFFHEVQADPQAHYTIGTGYFPAGKAAGAWCWPSVS